IGWLIGAQVNIRWLFTAQNRELARSPSWSPDFPQPLIITYDAQHGWRLDQPASQQLTGTSLADALPQDVCNTDPRFLSFPPQRQNAPIELVHDARLQGCEFSVLDPKGSVVAHLITRFGVLLTADAQAHALLPILPIASTTALAAITS